jgi:hypothetical protein
MDARRQISHFFRRRADRTRADVKRLLHGFALLASGTVACAQSATFTVRLLTPETALKAAAATREACRKQGYQVAVTVAVSGAPGGEADDRCAKAGLAAIRDDLDF